MAKYDCRRTREWFISCDTCHRLLGIDGKHGKEDLNLSHPVDLDEWERKHHWGFDTARRDHMAWHGHERNWRDPWEYASFCTRLKV